MLALLVASGVAFVPQSAWTRKQLTLNAGPRKAARGAGNRNQKGAFGRPKLVPKVVIGGIQTSKLGLDFIELGHFSTLGNSRARIYLLGGVVTSYTDVKGVEWVANRPDAKAS